MAHILVVDDEEKMRHLLAIMLKRRGHTAIEAEDGLDALDKIKKEPFDMVISDIKMPRMTGPEMLQKVKENGFSCPVVFITAFATVDSAVEIMRLGAADYITKPFEEEKIILAVERTLNLSKVLAENRELKERLYKVGKSDQIIYKSDLMKQAVELALKVAKSQSAVFITGESGTGKELFARFVHQESQRKDERFVAINCAAISPNLVESELFGHEKGAFTGADRRKAGKFEFANLGTIFLDEVGDLPLEAQAKLLRALQEKKVSRVGGNIEIDIDVRVICATNQNLNELVEQGKFRKDLYYRINVFPIETPPLRNRKEDIVPLCKYFLERSEEGKLYSLTEGAERTLSEHHWPGNVRELKNSMERAIIFASEQGKITTQTLSFLRNDICEGTSGEKVKLPPEGISLEEVQKELVMQALEASGHNQTIAAKLLGLTRAKFRVLMKNAKQTS